MIKGQERLKCSHPENKDRRGIIKERSFSLQEKEVPLPPKKKKKKKKKIYKAKKQTNEKKN